ncbi:MAG: DJ-1/PfpI/YhbO family deglycase/protease [Alphaproteobacteria bacterium]|nr:DJ-1/PfpI/YhbO family deglycase/protease [Alphaproteobacteria bacterium]
MPSWPKDVYQPQTSNRESDRSVLMLTADGVEDIEFFYPYYRFIEAGFRVDVVTPEGGEFKGKHGLGLKETMPLSDVDSDDYELLYLPGGAAPAELKKLDDAVELVKDFYDEKRPIAAVCHGPQLLAAADIISGRRIAAWPEVEEAVRSAGAEWANEETVVDEPFITARWPGDLPMQMRVILDILGDDDEDDDEDEDEDNDEDEY